MIKKYTKKNGETAWKIVAYLGVDPITGKQRRTTRQGFKTRREALQELRKLETAGIPDKVKQITLAELYADWWKIYIKTVRYSTSLNTKTVWRRYLSTLGDARVNKITVAKLQELFMSITHKDQLSRSVSVMTRLLSYAERLGYIDFNPMQRVTLPKSPKTRRKKIKFLTLEQVDRLLSNVQNSSFSAPIRLCDTTLIKLMVYSGLRLGETLALQWNDIKPDGAIKVSKTVTRSESGWTISNSPKTEAGNRTVYVDSKMLDDLKRWRELQQSKQAAKDVACSTVFTNTVNYDRFLNPSTMTRRFKKYLDGLPDITLHCLRHTHASLLFASGASMKDVQVKLGHSQIGVTMNVYTHLLPERMQSVNDQFFKYVRDEKSTKKN